MDTTVLMTLINHRPLGGNLIKVLITAPDGWVNDRENRRYIVAEKRHFCAEALEEALGQGQPDVFNTDQSPPLRRQGAASLPVGSSPKCCRAAA